MTTVSRVNTVSHSSVSGGGDWDHRLNRLLEDLQDTVVPPDTKNGSVSEYREYRNYSSTKHNDEPARSTEEKWVEYGTRGQDGRYVPALNDSAYSSNNLTSSREKTVNFSDDLLPRNYTSGGSSTSRNEFSSSTNKHVEFLSPANTTTILSSGPSSPAGFTSTSPNVERKEFYSKASYTALIKGQPGEVPPPPTGFENIDSRTDRRFLEDILQREALPEPQYNRTTSGHKSSTLTESRKTFSSESTRGTTVPEPAPLGPPLYSSTPVKTTTSNYSREVINDRSVTPPPPPSEGLKTPPLIRKVLQSSSNANFHSHHSNKTTTASRPPVIPSYDEPPEPRTSGTRYYTSTTTTEHRENRDLSPVKRFPSPQPPRDYGGPPKRLDELMATFDDSYTETRHISGDGGGPHKPHAYGPGTHPIEPVHHSQRTVRIEESSNTRRIINDDAETDLRQRNVNYQNPAYGGKPEPELTRNVAGPPVYYPAQQIFPKTENDALLSSAPPAEKSKDKGKKKEKEKMGKNKGEEKVGGAVPVPVCLPVCCAAPCTIM